MLLGPRPTSLPSGILIHPAILVTTDMSQKLVGAPLGEGDLDPNLSHNVNRVEAYLQAKFRVDPSNRLATIHQRHRQTGQNGTDRQRSDGIGRTVLQTVAQKWKLEIP